VTELPANGVASYTENFTDSKMGIDLMSISAHKMYGPKGIGALYISNEADIELQPVLYGGLQERGMRPGTLPVHQIVGFGEACRVSQMYLDVDLERATSLRNIFLSSVSDFSRANFSLDNTSPYIMNVCFPMFDEEKRRLIDKSEILFLSSRSACSTHSKKVQSHVLEELGFEADVIKNSYRISIGRFTTNSEITRSVSLLKAIANNEVEEM